MKTFIVVFMAVFAASQASAMLDLAKIEWNAFKTVYNKTYENHVEDQSRMKIFMEAKQKIAEHNRKFEAGEVSYKLAINKFADMDHDEFVRTMNGFKRPSAERLESETGAIRTTFIPPANVELPGHVDWRNFGAVTDVKDQGQCGSCWAFSSTGSLEGQHFRRTNRLVSLSEQNLVDCSGQYGNNGCNGGWMDQAFRYIKDNGGIDTEYSYPYEAQDGRCRFNRRTIGATQIGYVDLARGSEEHLKAAVATVGPIAIAIDASGPNFQWYSSGVYDEIYCSESNLDHGVLVVGYGTENGRDYWLVKNSWGAYWGEDGYIKMSRNRNNQCGIASAASYPLV